MRADTTQDQHQASMATALALCHQLLKQRRHKSAFSWLFWQNSMNYHALVTQIPLGFQILTLCHDSRTKFQLLAAGPTVVVDQQHCSSGQAGDSPRRSLLVYPRKNNFLIFDSRLGHGVLDTLSGSTRMTLLINWWHHKPMVGFFCFLYRQ